MDAADPPADVDDRAPWRTRLRALRPPEESSPPFDPDDVPDDPMRLVTAWFDEAITAGVPQAHAATLATAGADGVPHARTLLVKDLDDDGIWFSTSAHSPKGQQLAENPVAALAVYWRELGRQLRVEGGVVAGPPELSAADFLDRSVTARREMLVDRQSEPRLEPDAALADADGRLAADPDAVAPHWTAYLLRPSRLEFWASTADDRVRVEYRRTDAGWEHARLWV